MLLRQNKEDADKDFRDLIVIVFAVILIGGGILWGGWGAKAVAEGAGYDIKAEQHMSRLNEDLKSGKIAQHEYDIHKDQIRNGSLLK